MKIIDEPIRLVKSGALHDWYTIERVTHENESGLRPTMIGGVSCLMFYSSARIADADIEGTAEEMRAIAHAIANDGEAFFSRCSARTVEGGDIEFMSPRNSQEPVRVKRVRALALAADIHATLGGKSC